MEKDINDFLETCETLWKDFNNCKARFPYISPDAKGLQSVWTAPFYIKQGFNISFEFDQPLSEQAIIKNNQITQKFK